VKRGIPAVGRKPSHFFPQIFPFWIHYLDQREFPLSIPFLQLLFAMSRIGNEVVKLELNQTVRTRSVRESRTGITSMLPGSPREIRDRADIQGPVSPACENVDGSLLIAHSD
jgi:hypothetical protein